MDVFIPASIPRLEGLRQRCSRLASRYNGRMIGRVLHLICLTTIGAQALGALGAVAFYGHIIWSLSAGKEELGLAGFAVAGALMMGMASWGFALVAVLVFFIAARRLRFWRVAAPVPALVATVGFGAWILSGDPGDEHWLQIAFAVESSALLVTIVAVLFIPVEKRH